MPRAVIAAAVVVVVALMAIGAWRLIGTHQAPSRLALSNSTASGSPSALAGKWTVGSGSLVGYRAKEKFVNQPAETEAVARTSNVNGGFLVAVGAGNAKVSQMKFTVDLASLVSQDKYANYQVYQRDFFVRTIYLQTATYPTAVFVADPMTVRVPTGGAVGLDVAGKLTAHGVTHSETARVQAEASGAQGELAGSMSVDMRDFGIDPPDIAFTRAEPVILIEFDLKLVRG